jgi:hypothetical protein
MGTTVFGGSGVGSLFLHLIYLQWSWSRGYNRHSNVCFLPWPSSRIQQRRKIKKKTTTNAMTSFSSSQLRFQHSSITCVWSLLFTIHTLFYVCTVHIFFGQSSVADAISTLLLTWSHLYRLSTVGNTNWLWNIHISDNSGSFPFYVYFFFTIAPKRLLPDLTILYE